MSSTGRTLIVSLCLAAAGPRLAAAEKSTKTGKTDYAKEIAAFFSEMDNTYPFFDLKDIRRGWGPFKATIEKKARACKSDQEFLDLVFETVSYLRDGHMGVVKARVDPKPSEPEWYPGMSFLPASKERVIVMAGEKLPKDVKPGTIVAKIDGKDARTVLEAKAKEAWDRGGGFSSKQRARLFEFRIPLRGKKGEKHVLTVLDGKRSKTINVVSDVQARGWPHTYNMPEGLARRGTCAYGKLPRGVGYIYLRNVDNDTEPGIGAALEAHPDAKGWIVDIRGNGGGGYGPGLQGKIASIPKPVACIIDEGCVSAGETFARDIVNATGARLFGARTAGSSSAKRYWDFPSGIATLSVPTRSRVGLGRKAIEFFGISPQEVVEAVPEEVANGQNSEILRAEEFLLGSKPEKGAK
jgi:hypothetical protein